MSSAIKPVPRISNLMIGIAIGIYLVGVIICSVIFCRQINKDYLKSVDDRLRVAAGGGKYMIPEQIHDIGMQGGSIPDEDYMKLRNTLTQYTKDIDVRYVYSMVLKDGKICFTSDCESNVQPPVKFMSEYDDAPKNLHKAFTEFVPVVAEYTDKWGTFRSYFLPVKSPAGNTYVMGADMELKDIRSIMHRNIAYSIALAVMFMLLVLPLLIVHMKISARQEAMIEQKQNQLIHAGRLTAMGEMAAGMAHEINQPLCVIRGYLELLQAVLGNSPALKEKNLGEAFDIGIKCVDRASKIINHMRSFVRLKGSGPQSVSLAVVIEEGISFFQEQIRLHNIALEMALDKNVPSVIIDPQRFEQIVVNVISNARFSVDEMGNRKGRDFKKEIRMSLYTKDGEVVFEVKDNGLGMNAEVKRRCTEPFFSTKNPGEGTGLGLSIVRDILKEFDGRLELESVEGQGACFRFYFPAVPGTAKTS